MQAQSNNLVKRFVAPTMRRALDLVNAELGPEAVILSSKKIPQGVEVITSLEPDLPTRGIDVRREFGQHFDAELDTAMKSDTAWQMQAGIDQAAGQFGGRVETNEPQISASRSEELAREIEQARERMLEAKRLAKQAEQPAAELMKQVAQGANAAPGTRTQSQPAESHSAPPQENRQEPQHRLQADTVDLPQRSAGRAADGSERLETLQSEIADMRMLLEQQLWQINRSGREQVPGQVQMPLGHSVIEQHLSRFGLPETLAQRILQDVGQHASVSQTWRHCMASLSRQLPVVEQDFVDRGGVFAFVGQTGVGKTTTIAKLAARYVLAHGPGKVALVTTDTYRVGAYDQLRSMGRILNVPVRAVDAEHSLPRILASLKQFPLILIDTAGFRHGDPLLREQMRKLDACPNVKRVLVLACNSQMQTMKASSHAYSKRKAIDACVLTKLDEAASLGEALSVVLEHELPVAYTSNGQEIPRDIAKASAHNLVAAGVGLMKAETGQPNRAEC